MTAAGHDLDLDAESLRGQARTGERRGVVVLAPDEVDGDGQVGDAGQVLAVVLVQHPDQDVTHDALRGAVVGRPAATPEPLHDGLRHQVSGVQTLGHPEGKGRAGRRRRTHERDTGEDEGGDEPGVRGCEAHGDPSPEGVADHDEGPRARQPRHQMLGVVLAPPDRRRRHGDPEAGQVDGEGVAAVKDRGEVGAGSGPAVQGHDLRRSITGAVREHVTREDRQHADEASTGANAALAGRHPTHRTATARGARRLRG